MLDQLTLTQLRVQGTLAAVRADSIGLGPPRDPSPTTIPLEVDLELDLDLEDAGRSDDLGASIDLSIVARVIETISAGGCWGTLESLGLSVARTLLLPPAPGVRRARVDAVTLRIRRPAWLRSHATPGIVLRRARSWCVTERRVLGLGIAADVIAETRTTELQRIRLGAGAHWQLPTGGQALVLGGVELDGLVARATEGPGALLTVVRK